MKRLFDTNVVLDVLLGRQPWCDDAAALWQAMDDGQVRVAISASSVTDIHDIVRKGAGHQAASDAVSLCLDSERRQGLELKWEDKDRNRSTNKHLCSRQWPAIQH